MNDFFVKYVVFIQMYQSMKDKGVDVFIASGMPGDNKHMQEGQVFLCFTLRPYDGINLSMYLV